MNACKHPRIEREQLLWRCVRCKAPLTTDQVSKLLHDYLKKAERVDFKKTAIYAYSD